MCWHEERERKPDGKNWRHDCTGCYFLGTYYDQHRFYNNPIDIYVCTEGKKPGDVCIILRYGDNGPDYWSMSTFDLWKNK